MKGALNSSICSCPDCESMSCFTARSNAGNGCTCHNCKNPRTCLFFSNNSPNLKASKTDAYSQIHTELIRTRDKMKLPRHSACPKIHTCCGKALVDKLGKVDRADTYNKNNKEELKSSSRKGTDMLHKIKFNDLYELSHFDSLSVDDVEDDVNMDETLKADHREQASDICVKDNVSLSAMEHSQCANPCTFKSHASIEPLKLILLSKSKEARCETLNDSNLTDKIFNVVNSRSVSASKSDTTKITDQIRIKLDAYDANKMNKVKSKFGTSKFLRGNAEVTKEQVQKEIVYECESETNTEIKDSACTQQDDNNQDQSPESTVRSAAVSFCRSVTNKASAALLSSQVMDVPFMEFQKSLSFDHDHSADLVRKPKITKYDIFQKIKDVYKTCTCIVCDCIASVGLSPSIEKENCNCKPCDCDECRAHRSPKRHPASYRLLLDDFHNCGNIDNKKSFSPKTFSNSDACKAISELCDCKPCECLDCLKFNYLQRVSCDCKPCDCIECKTIRTKKPRTLIVAPVGEDSQHRQYCLCSPCACAECGFSYGRLSPNMTQDTGTSAYYRHNSCNCDSCINEACSQNGDMCICERHNKLMRKPCRSDKNDYNIHNVTVTNSSNFGKNRQNSTRNNHTVAMLTSFSYASKPNPDSNNFNTNHEKENGNVNNFKDSHISNMVDDCCDKENNCDINLNWNKNKTGHCLSGSNKHCNRNICINNTHLSLNCCDCEETKSYKSHKENFMNKTKTSKDAHVIKQKERSKNIDFNSDQLLVNKNNSNTLFAAKPWYLCKKSSTTENCEQNYRVFCMIPQQLDDCILHEKNTPNIMNNMNILTKTSCNVSETCAEFTKCTETDSDTSSYTSAKSLSLYPEVLSTVKNSGISKQLKRQANKSSDSCNSSGHDNSDYLIQFPRDAIEACIKDVLNLGTNINMTSVKCGSSVEENSISKLPEKLQQKDNSSRKGLKPSQIYSAVNSENINSNPNLKSQRYRCNCATCFCCGLCYMKKNEETQTLVKGKDQDVSTIHRANYTACLGTSTEDIVHRPFKFSLVDIQDQKKVFSTNDYLCNFKGNTAESTRNVLLNKLYSNTDVQFTPIIYDSVENTIQEARQFSVELLELLHKYEKANREFESVSEKLKMAQDAILNKKNNFNLFDSNAQRFEKPEKDQMVLNYEENANAPVNNHTETPMKMNKVYTTYSANIQKAERPINEFDDNKELIIRRDNKKDGHKEFLPNCSYEITGETDFDNNSEVDLKHASNTYKAYRRLIKKAIRITKHFHTRNIMASSSLSKISSRFESKMISTKSQTKREMEKETFTQLEGGNEIRRSSFKNIEIQFTEMSEDENVKHKKADQNFQEDFESQV